MLLKLMKFIASRLGSITSVEIIYIYIIIKNRGTAEMRLGVPSSPNIWASALEECCGTGLIPAPACGEKLGNVNRKYHTCSAVNQQAHKRN